jgi:hypothetical protein
MHKLDKREETKMPRVFMNKSGNQPTNLMDHSDDATQRGVRNWMHDKEYDPNQNHIIFDFETVSNGLNDREGEIDKSNRGQEPYEIGLSVRDRNGEWQHKSFTFTPKGINDGFNGGRRLFSPGTSHNRRAMGFTLEKAEVEEDGWIEDAPAWARPRVETVQELISPYTMGTGVKKELDWGEINTWLEGHGVSTNKKTNFIAHNNGFDFPLLERLMSVTDGGKNSTLNKLYSDVHPTAKKGMKFSKSGYWDGAWNQLTNFDWSSNDPKIQGRRVGDQSKGVFFHDTMVELGRLFADTNDKSNNNGTKLVLRKAHNTKGSDQYDFKKEYYDMTYDPLQEQGAKYVKGASIDAFRQAIGFNAFNEGADNAASRLFQKIADDINGDYEGDDGETTFDFIENLGLTESMAAWLEKRKGLYVAHSARDCYEAFNAVSGHSGAGDTAFMGEILMPFMTDLMDTFDHRKFRGPDADDPDLNDVQKFINGFNDFQTSWGGNKDENTHYGGEAGKKALGGILGAYPPASKRNKGGTYNQTVPALRRIEGVFPSGLLNGIITQLRDGNAWINFKEETKDAKGNIQTPQEGNPLSQRSLWVPAERKRRRELLREQEKNKAKEENREPEDIKEEDNEPITPEFEKNPDNQPDETQTPDNNGNSNSTSLDHLNDRLGWEHGAITFAKWKGYKHHDQGGGEPIRPDHKDLIIASVPIGNSRVAFRESRKTVNGVSISTFKPFLGITSFKDEKGKITERAIGSYVEELLGGYTDEDNPSSAVFKRNGDQINELLKGNLGAIRDHLSPHDSLTHANINTHINTPASAWLNKGLIHGQELTKEDIEGKNNPRNLRNMAHAILTVWEASDGIEGYNESVAARTELMDQYLAAPHLTPMLFGHEHRSDGQDWFTPDILEQFQNKEVQAQDISEAGGDELFQTDETNPQQIGVNLQQLKQLFLTGHGVEGMHPHQFLYDHPDGDFDPATAFTRFMMFMYEVQQEGLDPGVALGNSMYTEAAPPHNLEEPISFVENKNRATKDDGGDGSSAQSAEDILDNNDPEDVDPAVLAAAREEARRNAEARARLERIRNEENDENNRRERVKATIEELGLRSSPFIIQNNIQTPEAEASLEDAYNDLFKERVKYLSAGGVQVLLDDAVALYGQEGEKPSALNLARELEWIRINHTGDTDRYNSKLKEHGDPVLAPHALEEALVSNDRESVAGQWLDLFNSAYQAMGDFAPENIALLQEEVAQMGDTFMNNAHRDFLRYHHVDQPGNWVDVPEPISIQDHFTPPEEEQEEGRSLRDIARGMAIGTAKAPLNALKYYVNWNEISQQTRDAFSGREQAGRKLLDAARRGEPLEQVNIGTPEKPKTIGSIEEFNHYIGNLPVGSEHQPSLVRQFLFGRTTYDDLNEEQKESAKAKINNIGSSVKNLHNFTQETIQNRVPDIDITPKLREEAVGRDVLNQQERSAYKGRVKQAIQQDSPEEPSIGKSLDELREYLLRV